MRIVGTKLRATARDKGISVEQLGAAIDRTGLSGDHAASAIRNWMRGRDHPRCKKEDVQAIAGALGVTVPEIARFESVYKYHRGSPRKAKLLTDLIRGKNFDAALNLLTFTTKRAAVDVKKALLAAYADAEQAEADGGSLVVSDSRVDNGPVIKRFQPKDRGRAHPILKRMAHITVGLEEKKS